MKIKALSLAETLVTLVVIGVLCLSLMPMLQIRYKKETTQASFANAFKVTNKAFLNYSTKQHCNGKLDCTDLFSDNKTAEKLATQIDHTSITSNCWRGETIKNWNSSYPETDLNEYPCIIDGNEMIYAILKFANNCSTDLYNSDINGNVTNKLQQSCGYMYIDINGKKGPNTFGDDVFVFVITNAPPSYLYPVGGKLWKDDALFSNSKACPQDGRTCAGKIVEDGWKVTYMAK